MRKLTEISEFVIEYIAINSSPHQEILDNLKEFLEILDLDFESEVEDSTLRGFSRKNTITLNVKWYEGSENTFILKCKGVEEDLIIFREELEDSAKTYFDDIMLVFNEIARNYNTKCYEYLHDLENELRMAIIFCLAKRYGKRWWNQRIPSDIKDNHGERKGTKSKKIEDLEELRLKGHDSEDLHEIFYTYFPDLKKIIEKRDNWQEVFEDIFGRRDVLVKLDELYPLRNIIAHNRYLTKENADTVELYYKKLDRFLAIMNGW